MAAKQARITLTIGKGSEGPRSTGDISVLGLTFAFYQIWLYMAVFGAPKSFDSELFLAYEFAFPQSFHAILVYAFLISSAVLLIALSLFARKATPLVCSKKNVFASCAFMFIGTALLFFSSAGMAVVLIAAILMGVGTALLIILFGTVFSSFDFATCVLNAGLAFAIGFIGADAFVNWVPSPISGIIACLMPVLLLITFLRNVPDTSSPSTAGIPLKYVKPYITRLAISMAFLGLVIGSLRVVCGDKLLTSGEISLELVLGVACMTSAAVLVLAIALSKRTELWDSLLRNVTPAIMLGIASIALLAGDLKMFGAFFTTIGFACLISITWILLASFARNLNGSHVFMFGLGYGVIQASSIIGSLLANYLSSQGQLGASSINGPSDILFATSQLGLSDLAIVLMLIFSVGYSLVPRYRELKEILGSVMLALADRAREQAEEASAQEDSPEQDSSAQPSSSMSANTESMDGVGIEYPHSDAGQNSSQRKFHAEKLVEESESAPESSSTGQKTQSHRDQKGSFKRRCDELSEQYLLSAREREVFFLLAKGHNAAFLTDKLCISKSTAKTHINHIYKKLDVHTQQELLNMVEERHRGPAIPNVDRAALQDALRRAKEEGPIESNPSKLVESIRKDIL